jgi:hypothetical protein
MGKLIFYIVSIGLILLIGCALRPYWNKYFVNSDLEAAALYGTKHSVEDTQTYLDKKLKDDRYVLDPEQIQIEKDDNNTVSISASYQDKISFFGIVLKKLEFKLDVTQKYSQEMM